MKFSIVSAIYRVEKYLNQYIKSVVSQSIGFDLSIELILIDDGSDDASGNICKAWAEKFPNNVKYQHQQNEGVSSARNAGLALATGDWITFCDPDDFLHQDYFACVEEFLVENAAHLPAVMACNIIYFDDKTKKFNDTHPLRYKFAKGNRISDLDSASKPELQLQAASTIFNRKKLIETGLSFRFIKPVFEDADFIARFFLAIDSRLIGFVPSAHYFYRKRNDGSSLIDKSYLDPSRYSDLLEYGYLALLRDAYNITGSVPLWIQRLIVYDLNWQIRVFIDNHRASSVIGHKLHERYHYLLSRIFFYIQPQTIYLFELAVPSALFKLGVLHLYKNVATHDRYVELVRVDRHQKMALFALKYSVREPKLEFLVDSIPVALKYKKVVKHTFVGKTFLYEVVCWLPISNKSVVSVLVNQQNVPIANLETGKIHQQNTLIDISAIPIPLELSIAPQLALEHRSYGSQQKVKAKYDNAWLLLDREDEADDNAEHLYRHIKNTCPEQKIFFSLKSSSKDWPRLLDEGFNFIEFGTAEYIGALQNVRCVISSQASSFLPAKYFADRMNFSFVFLTHGVMQADLSFYLDLYRYDILITSAEREKAALIDSPSPYYVSEKEVRLTGLPRYDGLMKLNQEHKNLLLVMPTWRHNLKFNTNVNTFEQYKKTFLASEYYKNWAQLLKSKKLIEYAKNNNLKIVYCAHAMLGEFASEFKSDDVEIYNRSGHSIQSLFSKVAILITDYSSVAFDIALLKQSIIYYQFDREDFFSGNHTAQKGYFDYYEDGFGVVCENHENVMHELAHAESRKFKMESIYEAKVNTFFKYIDANNCARVLSAIREDIQNI